MQDALGIVEVFKSHMPLGSLHEGDIGSSSEKAVIFVRLLITANANIPPGIKVLLSQEAFLNLFTLFVFLAKVIAWLHIS